MARLLADHAVSPVIGTLLLVVTAIVLVGGVYTWAGAFSEDGEPPPRSMSVTSAEPLRDDGVKAFSVPAATPGLKWEDLAFTVAGAPLSAVEMAGCPDPVAGEWIACRGGATQPASAVISAGDVLKVHASRGDTFRVLDARANAVIVSAVVS